MQGAMVRVILEGRKTQTRRVIKGLAPEQTVYQTDNQKFIVKSMIVSDYFTSTFYPCPYGVVGDRLWVRETWYEDRIPELTPDQHGCVHYQANQTAITKTFDGNWRPSIFMPRWASRIILEITGIRVERVRDIGEKDAIAEGFPYPTSGTGVNPILWYFALWDRINHKRGFGCDVNPWVWVIEFKRIEP